jgi:hypothetical protein
MDVIKPPGQKPGAVTHIFRRIVPDNIPQTYRLTDGLFASKFEEVT